MPSKEKAPHILNTAATLLWLCFIVLTSLKINDKTAGTFVDEFTAVAILMFMASCIMSFVSLSSDKTPSHFYEKIADIIFLIGLFCLLVTTILIVFNIIQ